MKTLAFTAALTLFAAASAHAQKPKGALDGKTFAVETAEKGKATGEKDSLVFKDGKFRSPGCDQYGFGEAPYTTAKAGDATKFDAETSSVKEGKIKWTGTVKGDAIEGSYLWTKPGQKPIEYWFKSAKK
jgi:hypothetical protein